MSGNKIIDECFNIRSRPKTITKDICTSIEKFIDDNCNVFLKTENSGDVFVKYMTIFYSFVIASTFFTIS